MDSDSIYKEQVNQIGPRVVGTIVLLCSLSMLSMAWKRRDRLFHRLVLGKSSLKSKEEEEERRRRRKRCEVCSSIKPLQHNMHSNTY